MSKQMTGIELIAKERQQRIYDVDNPYHQESELAIAGACYAVEGTSAEVTEREHYEDAFPWSGDWDKRDQKSIIERLIIAGACIATELDRLTQSLQTCTFCKSDYDPVADGATVTIVAARLPNKPKLKFLCQACGTNLSIQVLSGPKKGSVTRS